VAEVHLLPELSHLGVRSWRSEKSLAVPKSLSLLGQEVALDPLGDLERLLDAVDSLREDLH